jgi:hypothetical protein
VFIDVIGTEILLADIAFVEALAFADTTQRGIRASVVLRCYVAVAERLLAFGAFTRVADGFAVVVGTSFATAVVIFVVGAIPTATVGAVRLARCVSLAFSIAFLAAPELLVGSVAILLRSCRRWSSNNSSGSG